MLEIYTDGAYANSRDQGGWAFVAVGNGKKLFSNYGLKCGTTNNRMEIEAVIQAMRWMLSNDLKSAKIYTDSMYVIGTMTQNWKRNKNVDLWEMMDELISKLRISYKHVKGHAGDTYNEMCDTLAVHASHIDEIED